MNKELARLVEAAKDMADQIPDPPLHWWEENFLNALAAVAAQAEPEQGWRARALELEDTLARLWGLNERDRADAAEKALAEARAAIRLLVKAVRKYPRGGY